MTIGANIPIRNVFYMLSYAFKELQAGEYARLAAEDFEHVHDLLAAILVIGLGRQLKQGLYREYVEEADELQTLRGRLDIEGTIQARFSRRQSIACRYDELSVNNPLNRAVKATCLLLIRHGEVGEARKRALLRLMPFLQDVGEADPRAIRWGSFRHSHASRGYLTLLAICQMAVEGMLPSTEAGDRLLREFGVDASVLPNLYERFILNYYRVEHPEVSARAPYIPWAIDEGDTTLLPTMRSDITLSQGCRELIIDAKFYKETMQSYHGSRTLISANMYQIFTYVKNREAGYGDTTHEVSGMLLYARTRETLQPNASYLMSGSRIAVRTLDLSLAFADIAAQLDAIVEEHFGA